MKLKKNNEVLINNLIIAKTFLTRLQGLLGRDSLPRDSAMLFENTHSVHTFHMKFSIDVVFLDANYQVKKIAADVRPWRAAGCWSSTHLIEMTSGLAEELNIQKGDRLDVVD